MAVGAEKHLLRHVQRVRLVAEDAVGGGIDHVPIGGHEFLKFIVFRHAAPVGSVANLRGEHDPTEYSFKNSL